MSGKKFREQSGNFEVEDKWHPDSISEWPIGRAQYPVALLAGNLHITVKAVMSNL